MSNASVFTWLAPTLMAMFLYGIGQGLVKKYIAEVPPARFCLYFIFAKAIVNLWYFFSNEHPDPFAIENRQFLLYGVLAYVLDGAAWILYFQSIVSGPITIVGTLSAAYPAMTVIFARIFLNEALFPIQYVGVVLVIVSCIGLSYAPDQNEGRKISKRWIPMAASALVLWGVAQTLVKYSYTLPGSSDANMALFNTMGGFMTLGVYGFLYGRQGVHSVAEWFRSFTPMGMMAMGDLAVIVASSTGPVSVVTPLSGAYPVVTLAFAWFALKEKISKSQWVYITMILVGMYLSPGSA